MSRYFLPSFFLLAALWGASFMFIKIADRELQPTTMMAGRLVLASTILFVLLASREGVRPAVSRLRGAGLQAFALGIVAAALPFTLIAWGEKHIDSGVAAIANASMPIFIVLIAIRFLHSERATGLRLVGILLGLVGVGVLVGVHPSGGWLAVARHARRGRRVDQLRDREPLGAAPRLGRIAARAEHRRIHRRMR